MDRIGLLSSLTHAYFPRHPQPLRVGKESTNGCYLSRLERITVVLLPLIPSVPPLIFLNNSSWNGGSLCWIICCTFSRKNSLTVAPVSLSLSLPVKLAPFRDVQLIFRGMQSSILVTFVHSTSGEGNRAVDRVYVCLEIPLEDLLSILTLMSNSSEGTCQPLPFLPSHDPTQAVVKKNPSHGWQGVKTIFWFQEKENVLQNCLMEL